MLFWRRGHRVAVDMARGLAFLHSRHIIHVRSTAVMRLLQLHRACKAACQ